MGLAPSPKVQDISSQGQRQTFFFGGKTIVVSAENQALFEALTLDPTLRNTPLKDIVDVVESHATNVPRKHDGAAVDLKNAAHVSLPFGIRGVFPYNDFDVVINPNYANQTLYVPTDKIYEAYGRTFIFKGSEIVLPYACILYPDGGITNFKDCPLKVWPEDIEVNLL